MTKLMTVIVFCCLMVGAVMFVNSKVNPGITAKANSVSTGINTATVNSNTGAITVNAP
jgi:hypothetical protein